MIFLWRKFLGLHEFPTRTWWTLLWWSRNHRGWWHWDPLEKSSSSQVSWEYVRTQGPIKRNENHTVGTVNLLIYHLIPVRSGMVWKKTKQFMGDKLSASPNFVHEQYQIHKSMSDDLPFAIPSAPCKASCHRAAVFFTGFFCCKWYRCLKTTDFKGIRNWYSIWFVRQEQHYPPSKSMTPQKAPPDTWHLPFMSWRCGFFFRLVCQLHPPSFLHKDKKKVWVLEPLENGCGKQPKIETCGVIFSS